MKYIYTIVLLSYVFFASGVSANTTVEQNAANFLAKYGIIESHISSPSKYLLDSTITRREMLKVMMNLSKKEVSDTCEGKFQDLSSDDWGCKYAETALTEGYIAGNVYFRPDDSVTQAEALKMIMQVIEREKVTEYLYTGGKVEDWRQQYVLGGLDLLGLSYGEVQDNYPYDKLASRSFVFLTTSRSSDEFNNNTQNWQVFSYPTNPSQITPEFWSVKYPETWIYRELGDTIGFGSQYGENSVDGLSITPSFKTVSELVEEAQKIPSGWELLFEPSVSDIVSDSGVLGVFIVVPVKSFDDTTYRYITVIMEGENQNYVIQTEFSQRDIVEGFYKTFEIITPQVAEQDIQVYDDFEVIDGNLYFTGKGVNFNYNKVERGAGEFNILDQMTFDTYQGYKLEGYPDYDFMPETYDKPFLIAGVDMGSFTEYGRGTEGIVYLDLNPAENKGRSYLTKILVAEDKNNLYYVLEYKYGCMGDTVGCLGEEEIEVISK